jgi:hypothetical protein
MTDRDKAIEEALKKAKGWVKTASEYSSTFYECKDAAKDLIEIDAALSMPVEPKQDQITAREKALEKALRALLSAATDLTAPDEAFPSAIIYARRALALPASPAPEAAKLELDRVIEALRMALYVIENLRAPSLNESLRLIEVVRALIAGTVIPAAKPSAQEVREVICDFDINEHNLNSHDGCRQKCRNPRASKSEEVKTCAACGKERHSGSCINPKPLTSGYPIPTETLVSLLQSSYSPETIKLKNIPENTLCLICGKIKATGNTPIDRNDVCWREGYFGCQPASPQNAKNTVREIVYGKSFDMTCPWCEKLMTEVKISSPPLCGECKKPLKYDLLNRKYHKLWDLSKSNIPTSLAAKPSNPIPDYKVWIGTIQPTVESLAAAQNTPLQKAFDATPEEMGKAAVNAGCEEEKSK